MKRELVINTPTRMCCGLPASECRCGEPPIDRSPDYAGIAAIARTIVAEDEALERQSDVLPPVPTLNDQLLAERRPQRQGPRPEPELIRDDDPELLVPPTIDWKAVVANR